jgi:nitrous oxidase accessory protein NosD
MLVLFLLVPAVGTAGVPVLLNLGTPAGRVPRPAEPDRAPAPPAAAPPPPVPVRPLQPSRSRTPETSPAGSGTAAASGPAGCARTAAAAFTTGAAPTSTGSEPVEVRRLPGRAVPVSTAAGLVAALAAARPGDTLLLAPGRYAGRFTAHTPGTAAAPVTLAGSCAAVLSGGGTASGYALHLDGADHWRLTGFTVTGGQKGIVLDRTSHAVLSHLTVGDTGEEGVHLRAFSSSDVVQSSVIQRTGLVQPPFGEGLYLGSARSNWGTVSGGGPDASDGDRALRNTFRDTAAENVDVKEGTSGGVLAGNSFDGSALSGENSADSVVDVKGVRYRVSDNRTSGAGPHLKDAIQTHVITDPATSGCGNTFSGNTVSTPGVPVLSLDRKCG